MDRANQDPEVQLQQAEDAEAEKEKKVIQNRICFWYGAKNIVWNFPHMPDRERAWWFRRRESNYIFLDKFLTMKIYDSQ